MRIGSFEEARSEVIRSKDFAALSEEDKVRVATTLTSALDELNRDAEKEADLKAVRILKTAGITPEPFAAAIEGVGAELGDSNSYLTPSERAKLIREEAKR